MGPFYESVKARIQKTIANPDLLLDADKWGTAGQLPNREWDEPEVFWWHSVKGR